MVSSSFFLVSQFVQFARHEQQRAQPFSKSTPDAQPFSKSTPEAQPVAKSTPEAQPFAKPTPEAQPFAKPDTPGTQEAAAWWREAASPPRGASGVETHPLVNAIPRAAWIWQRRVPTQEAEARRRRCARYDLYAASSECAGGYPAGSHLFGVSPRNRHRHAHPAGALGALHQ